MAQVPYESVARSERFFFKIGHRGASGYFPENTILAFGKALELGANSIEFDVHTCATGELVVIHDATLERTTNGTGLVSNFSLTELKRLDAGEGERIPTLTETLSFIDRRAQVNIELKGKGTARPVAEAVQHSVRIHNWSYDDFIISSFDHEQLREIQKLIPNLTLAPIWSRLPHNYLERARDLHASIIITNYLFIAPEQIADIKKHGFKVFVYTVNDPDDIARLKSWDVDGIASDFPDRL
jgi:glycerophosphoryl diester phosphodiesterase